VFGYSSVSRRQDGLQLATILAVALAVITPAQAFLGGLLPQRAALIVGAAGLAVGLASQGLQALERRRQAKAAREAALAALLARWPLPAARDADPYDLGVDPPRDPAEPLPYIARDADAEIQAAVTTDPFVLVTGPRLAGKTRSAFEALGAALPDARVIVPRSASAFARLVALEHPAELRETTVLWLDGLADFLRDGGLDSRVLDDAAAMRPPVTIVATIGDDERAALLREGGDVARRTRTVLAHATTIALPGALTHREQQRAAQLYDRPVLGLVGANFAADAELLNAPAPPPPPEPEPVPAHVPAAAPRRLATTAARRRWRIGLIGASLAALAILMPVAALPAAICGAILIQRRQIARGAAIIAAAVVFAAAGVGLVAAVTPTTKAGPTDEQVLTRYFGDRYAACLRGATPEFPNCGIVLSAPAQQAWVAQNGYTGCRAGGGSPRDCVARLP
jgi:hypothetical protein